MSFATGDDHLQQIATGYVESKILLAAVELRVFDHLREPAEASAVAEAVGGSLRGCEILLDALVAMELADKVGGRYRLRDAYREALVSGPQSHFVHLLRHRNRLFRRWAFLEEIIRGETTPEAVDSAMYRDPQVNRDFIRAMVAAGRGRSREVAAIVDLDGAKTVADLGGGPGHYLAEFLRRSPGIEPYLCDLPMTLDVSREIHAKTELGARGRFVAWDLFAEDPPSELPPLDLAFISQVMHGASEEDNRALLRKLRTQMAPGGRVVVHENVVDDGRTSPREAALFAVNMLAMTEGGRTYTEAEILGWGADAGFEPLPGHRANEWSYLVSMRRPE